MQRGITCVKLWLKPDPFPSGCPVPYLHALVAYPFHSLAKSMTPLCGCSVFIVVSQFVCPVTSRLPTTSGWEQVLLEANLEEGLSLLQIEVHRGREKNTTNGEVHKTMAMQTKVEQMYGPPPDTHVKSRFKRHWVWVVTKSVLPVLVLFVLVPCTFMAFQSKSAHVVSAGNLMNAREFRKDESSDDNVGASKISTKETRSKLATIQECKPVSCSDEDMNTKANRGLISPNNPKTASCPLFHVNEQMS